MGFLVVVVVDILSGIVVVFRLPRLARREPEDYPGVDPQSCREWLRADLNSAYAHVIMSASVILPLLAFIAVLSVLSQNSRSGMSSDDTVVAPFLIMGAVWIGLSIWHGRLSRKAAHLKLLMKTATVGAASRSDKAL